MTEKLFKILVLIALLFLFPAWGQYPQSYIYNDANGLPSNEVYSIIQDERSFVWFGCDAGLYKFDGINYHLYKSETQKSKSKTGLTLSKSGKIYCHNFHSQIFFTEGEELKELAYPYAEILSLTGDDSGNLIVSHHEGLAIYNEAENKWKNYSRITGDPEGHSPAITRSAAVNSENKIAFLVKDGIGIYDNNELNYYTKNSPNIQLTSYYILKWIDNEPWAIPYKNNAVYKLENEEFVQVHNKNLLNSIKNNQITEAKVMSDGYLWICTYNGVIRYDPKTDEVLTLYPEIAFSDSMIDREGNYWFSSLQHGIFRVPDLEYIVWNDFRNSKLSKITTDKSNIYFSTVNGDLGILGIQDENLELINTGSKSDIQSLNYIEQDDVVFLYNYGNIYTYGKSGLVNRGGFDFATKYLNKHSESYFLSTSSGLYTYNAESNISIQKLIDGWTRETLYDPKGVRVWAATNDGLLILKRPDGWIVTDTIFPGKQILSIDFDKSTGKLYSLAFDGEVSEISQNLNVKKIGSLPTDLQTYRIRHYKNRLYIATNQGVLILNPEKHTYRKLSISSGLASNSILDLLILNNNLWLATGNGLQKIPLNTSSDRPLAKVYVKNKNLDPKRIILQPNDNLVLFPEASAYSSGGNFEYAYKINNNEWVLLPSNTEKIEFQNLPKGDFNIELKVIDYLGRDSENILSFNGYVKPHFWETIWFIIIAILASLAIIFLIMNRIIKEIREKEQRKNELLLSQLKAIRAQMNPHFMYNTLNSIQDLILQNDIKNTNYYLSRFSQLMRQILDFSREESILLSQETDMLNNYLKLEKLRFGDEFKFEIKVDNRIDSERTYIPSLMLQPFVENSIKHGLLHKKGEKELKIDFGKRNEELHISIYDNGVGRERSKEIHKKSKFKHKSFAGEAVQKRVELLNSGGKYKIRIETSDLYPEQINKGARTDIYIIALDV